ncbi:MAG: glucose-6-phosphate dehydrogenase [Thermodesulfobacteriota bacterium]
MADQPNTPDMSKVEAESLDPALCRLERVQDPAVIVIFGATGDLTWRKLFPSLFALYQNQLLPENVCIVGTARSRLSHDDFRKSMRRSVEPEPDREPTGWDALSQRLFYHPVSYDQEETFTSLKSFLDELDVTFATQGNRLFYLAVPPNVYPAIAHQLGRAGLTQEDSKAGSWIRFVVEKPFGHDLESARELDKALHSSFAEHQIFRIDHYLAKETVQNILMLRFANSIFEPIWDRRYIDSVSITAAEQLGVEHRAGYYDRFGILRDMFQNHMMQLLALCAMEPPSIFEAERVRDEKTKVYRCLRPFPTSELDNYLVLGQYAAGQIKGKKVRGYREEPNVDPQSLTPTFASMKVFLDNWRWQGVPFYLTSGKRLAEKRTEIKVQFKHVPNSMFRGILGEDISANRLTLGIQPKEEIHLSFQTKVPGPKVCLRTVKMHFDYNQGYTGPVLEAYQKVLLDCLLGDHTLFWRQDGVELCWGFLTPILIECDCPDQGKRLHTYEAGTWGPEAVNNLLPSLPGPNR